MSEVDEFDTVAAWTLQAVEALGVDDVVPAACNGSGNPAWLGWLSSRTAMGPGRTVVDTGGGLGGAAAWLARHSGAAVLLAEPMAHAARGARRLFGLPSVVAWSHQLPLVAGSVDVALALAVLSTVDDKEAYLAELARVLAPGGALGLIEYVTTAAGTPAAPDAPEGNEFLRRDDLFALLSSGGFDVVEHEVADQLPEAPAEWDDTDRRVTAEIQRRHGHHPAWREAAEQRGRFGRLLERGSLGVVLVHAARRNM